MVLLLFSSGCVPDLVAKNDRSLVACSAPAFEEWNYDVGLREGRGASLPDLDGDGLGDAAIAFQLSETLAIRWGSTSAVEGLWTKEPVSRANGWVRHGDFDDNGLGDLIVASTDVDNQTILLQKEPRKFEASTLTQATVGRVLVVDVDRDGNQDLLFQMENSFVVRAGDGNGDFADGKVFSGILHSDSFDSGDFDGDGVFELLRIRTNAPLTILTFDNDGIGETPIDESGIEDVPRDQRIVMVQDIDGDGRSEALVITRHSEEGYVEIRTHNHDATPRFDRCWRVPNPPSLVNDAFRATDPNTRLGFMTAGDVNGDGKLDALFYVGCPFCVYDFSVMVQAP